MTIKRFLLGFLIFCLLGCDDRKSLETMLMSNKSFFSLEHGRLLYEIKSYGDVPDRSGFSEEVRRIGEQGEVQYHYGKDSSGWLPYLVDSVGNVTLSGKKIFAAHPKAGDSLYRWLDDFKLKKPSIVTTVTDTIVTYGRQNYSGKILALDQGNPEEYRRREFWVPGFGVLWFEIESKVVKAKYLYTPKKLVIPD